MQLSSEPKLWDEAGRLAALERYQVMDSEPDIAFDHVTALVRRVLRVPMVAVSLLDMKRQWFKSRQGLTPTETARDISFCDHTIRCPDSMFVRDTLDDPRFRDNPLVTGPPYIRSYLGIPLRTPDGYHLGGLCVLDTVPRHFDGTQIDTLKGFAAIIENELELRLIARSDHLTGILSRGAFIGEMERAVAHFKRHRRPGALVTFDIDHFKQVNDTFGHAAGDITLRTVAECCRSNMRGNEIFGRVGGEEFALLLVEGTLSDAVNVAERMRTIIEGLWIPHDPPLQVTASFGVAGFANFETWEAWMDAADQALYTAKEAGRNRCSVFSRTPQLHEKALL